MPYKEPPTIGIECRECHTSLIMLYKDFDKPVDWVKLHLVDLMYIHVLERHPDSIRVKGVPPEQAKKEIYEWLVPFPPPFEYPIKYAPYASEA